MNLTIKDLSTSTELDQAAMSAVRGGDYGNANVSNIGQLFSVQTPVLLGAGADSAVNNTVDITATQHGSIRTDQHAGDAFSFMAGLYGMRRG